MHLNRAICEVALAKLPKYHGLLFAEETNVLEIFDAREFLRPTSVFLLIFFTVETEAD
jgi:hypothetical protein